MEKIDTKELKWYARSVLNGKHASLAGITLLLTALNLLLNFLCLEAAPYGTGILSILLYFGCSILINMIYYILLAGLYGIYLNICNNRSFRWTDLFSGFTQHPEPVAIYSLVQYALAYICTQIGVWWLSEALNLLFYGDGGNLLLATVVTAIAAVLYIFLKLSLSMVLFVHADHPNLSFREMLKEGWQLMNGNRPKFFYLGLSFLGMVLLGLLSFGIGFLFVEPYIYTTEGYFYKKISGH
ncbi:MAG: DUF975 family protein [Lachnospiraceae bacterium]|nr:DUF975 family protein [Lachnospiraceae bacterium]